MTTPTHTIDRYQQRHAWLGFPFAVYRKFSEDGATNLAALMTYFAFLSVFPLLLLLVTILGFVLAGNPELQDAVFSSALGQFPIIGAHSEVNPLQGSPLALVVGLVLATWSGLAVAQTAQTAFNTVYDVPRVDWPGFLPKLTRSLELVAVAGTGLIVTTTLQAAVSGTDAYGLQLGAAADVAAAMAGIALNTLLFGYLFIRATAQSLRWPDVFAGATVAAIAWFALQKVGTSLVHNKINGAQGTYGTFAAVIGLLFWFFLLALITMLCAEINVVRSKRLWPRGLSTLSARASTEADHRAYRAYPQREHKAHNVDIETYVRGDHNAATGAGTTDAAVAVPAQRDAEHPVDHAEHRPARRLPDREQ